MTGDVTGDATGDAKRGADCAAKRRYATEREARDDAKRVKTARGWRLKPYSCPACGLWHLTKKRPRRNPR